MSPKCPGQDQRYWKPDAIFDVRCPYCGRAIEFWKDEPSRVCRGCAREVRNPRIDLSCAEWCAEAEACLGHSVHGTGVAEPVVERLMALLEARLSERPDRLERARQVCARVDTLLQAQTAEPSIAKPAALLAGVALEADDFQRDGDPLSAERAFLESGVIREILAAAGIADPKAATIEQLVRSLFAEQPHDDDAELEIVRDAVRLVHASRVTE
jgi:hypothetical protein